MPQSTLGLLSVQTTNKHMIGKRYPENTEATAVQLCCKDGPLMCLAGVGGGGGDW